MFEFLDRVATYPNRKLITYEDGTTAIATIARNDEPTQEGTSINRETMMALQGFAPLTTTFTSDGKSCVETNESGHTRTTTINDDGTITEVFKGKKTLTKTTTISGLTIKEEVTQ